MAIEVYKVKLYSTSYIKGLDVVVICPLYVFLFFSFLLFFWRGGVSRDLPHNKLCYGRCYIKRVLNLTASNQF